MDILKTAAIINSKSTTATSVIIYGLPYWLDGRTITNREQRIKGKTQTETKSTNRVYTDVCHRTGQTCMLDVNTSEKTVDTCCDKSFMILYGKYNTHTWGMLTMYHVILLDQILLLN